MFSNGHFHVRSDSLQIVPAGYKKTFEQVRRARGKR